MKKTMKTLLALMAGVVAFSACSNEDALTNDITDNNPEAQPILSFKASTESDGATRATIDGFDVKWQEGDAIWVMSESNSAKYVLSDGAGTTSGTFSIDSESQPVSGDGSICALYPYASETLRPATKQDALGKGIGDWQIDSWKLQYEDYTAHYPEDLDEFLSEIRSEMDGSGVSEDSQAIILAYIKGASIPADAPEYDGYFNISNVSLPAVQTIEGEQVVDPKAMLMVARANGDNLSYKNVCSYIKVRTGESCKKIEVRSHNGESLAGMFSVDSYGATVSGEVSYGSDVVTLQAADDGVLEGNKTYYIAVLPGELYNGLEIRYYPADDEGVFKYNSSSSYFRFERNMIYNGGNMHEVSTSAVYWPQNTMLVDLFDYEEVNEITSVNIMTGIFPHEIPGFTDDCWENMPDLGGGRLWCVKIGETLYIGTDVSRICATTMEFVFSGLTNMTTCTGLDNIDVSESSSFSDCFSECSHLTSLDLSSWMIKPSADTRSMFRGCQQLTSLTLNNSFHAGDEMFTGVGGTTDEGCVVYGVTDEDVKGDLMGEHGTDTGWNHGEPELTKIRFDGE